MAERSVEQLRAHLAKNRTRMVDLTVEAKEALTPQHIAQKATDEVKQFAKTEFDAVTSSFKDAKGLWRKDRLLLIGAAVLGVVAFSVTVNQVANRRAISSATRKAIEK